LRCDVLVVGAGSVGLPLAYFLSKRGLSVIVVDKLSSAGQGSNKTAIGGIRATHTDSGKIRVASRSLEIVSRWEGDTGDDIGWRRGGYVFVAHSEETAASFRESVAFQQSVGLKIDWVGADRIAEIVQGINKTGLLGGTYSPGDGSASPLLVADSYYRQSLRLGACYHYNTEIVRAEVDAGRVVAMIAADGTRYTADTFVNAAGAWASQLASLYGVSGLPVVPDSHEGGITEPVARMFDPMIVDLRSDDYAANFYFYQGDEGQVVFCCTPRVPVVGTDTRSTSGFLPYISRRMIDLYPRLARLKVRRTWRGTYPMTPDGSPIVEYAQGLSNVIHAVGMCGQGFMLGPGLGEILAEHIVDGSGAEDIIERWSSRRSFEMEEALK
jgi:sarcosine oxidase subunit beta